MVSKPAAFCAKSIPYWPLPLKRTGINDLIGKWTNKIKNTESVLLNMKKDRLLSTI